MSKKRKRRFNHHHIVNRHNGGNNSSSNLIRLETVRHGYWHKVFKNLSFIQAARLLVRAWKLKTGEHYVLMRIQRLGEEEL